MKVVKIYLPRDLKYINIHIFSDWHLGDPLCKIDKIKSLVEAVKADENAFVLINGDLINNATKQSVSDSYGEILSPMEQIELAYELLEPIKDKIIAMTSGNHEDRSYKESGVDLTGFLAVKLGVQDRYDPIATAIYLRLGELKNKLNHKGDGGKRQVCYKIYMTHGSGGGRTEGAKINSLVRLQSIIDADVYIHSHTHQGAVLKGSRLTMDMRNSTIKQEECLFVNSAAQLNYGGYGEKFGFKPTSTCQPMIYLCGTNKEFEGKL